MYHHSIVSTIFNLLMSEFYNALAGLADVDDYKQIGH